MIHISMYVEEFARLKGMCNFSQHADLLPKEAQECAISQEAQDLLHKAGALRTLMAATKKSLPNAKRKTQVAVAALLLHSMTKRTKRSSSHRRSVLGDKGNALEAEGNAQHTKDMGVRTGHNDVSMDGWTTVRRARARAVWACARATE